MNNATGWLISIFFLTSYYFRAAFSVPTPITLEEHFGYGYSPLEDRVYFGQAGALLEDRGFSGPGFVGQSYGLASHGKSVYFIGGAEDYREEPEDVGIIDLK